MADPANMTDEELNKVIETGVEPDEPQSEVEEQPAEETEEKPEAVEEPAEEAPEAEQTEEKEPEQPSRRESLRIQDLLKKYGPPPERPQNVPQQRQDALDYGQALDADPEVIRQLEADRTAAANQANQTGYSAGLEQAKAIQFHTRLEVDAPRVESKYKFLDPNDKEHFDPVRADAMNTLYINASGYDPGDPQRGIPETVINPNIRYKDFVEAQMEFAEALMAERQAASTKNIAKQAATTGLRPDGSSAKRLNLNQAPQDMTDEELYASIGQPMPKK
jgi:hypothetical protein